MRALRIEHVRPTDDDRDIETFNVDFNAFLSHIQKLNLAIYAGLTAGYANGYTFADYPFTWKVAVP